MIFGSILQESNSGKEDTFQPNLLMLGLSPSAYVLRAISSVRPSDLEQALLVRCGGFIDEY